MHLSRHLRACRTRLGALPPGILVAQLFLASGWLRAAVAHGIDTSWWAGDALVAFRLDDTAAAISWYRLVLDGAVMEYPTLTGLLVLVGEAIVGIGLLVNHRPLSALALGTFLNVQFILAGVVNPSIFYLIVSAVIVLWHLDVNLPATTRQRVVRTAAVGTVFTVVVLAPEIDTIEPAHVIDDPALVLCFVALLFTVAAKSANVGSFVPEPGLAPESGRHGSGRANGHTVVASGDIRPVHVEPAARPTRSEIAAPAVDPAVINTEPDTEQPADGDDSAADVDGGFVVVSPQVRHEGAVFEAIAATEEAELSGPIATVGEATLRFDHQRTRIDYRVYLADVETDTEVHLHLGSPVGDVGPSVAQLLGADPGRRGRSDRLVRGTLTAFDLQGPLAFRPLSELVDKLITGEAFIRVDTFRPSGEASTGNRGASTDDELDIRVPIRSS